MKANRPLRAEEICRDWLVEHPGSVEHMRLLSHSLMKQNRLPGAEQQVRFALELQPNNPQLLEDLGLTAYWDSVGCTWNGDKVECRPG